VTENRIDLLKNMPVFGGTTDETVAFVLEQTRDFMVPAGECFFREGDTASSFYVLEGGRVEVVRSHQGRDFRLSELGPGDCFGEMSLIECRERSATVRAIEDCTAIELPLKVLHDLYEHDLEQFVLVEMNIAREISRRLRAADRRLFDGMVTASELAEEYWWYLI
jgi:CRP-like cAMP-binding protein